MKKSKIFLYFSLCFIVGVGLRSLVNIDLFYIFILGVAGLTAAFLVRDNFKLRILFLGGFFLFLGVWRFDVSIPRMDEKHIAFYNGRVVELVGRVSAEPDVRETHVKLTTNNLQLTTNNKKIKGKILVNVVRGENFKYGDQVELKCRLAEPGVIEDFDYGRYLGVKGVYAVCYSPVSVERIQVDRDFTPLTTRLYANVLGLKQKFKKVIDSALPLPQSGLLNAMLLGYRREIRAETSEAFAEVGLSHIVAISGLHITILAGILFYIFILLGVPRGKSFWPAVLILLLYVGMIGFRASAVRALIMGSLVLYALKIGRLSKALNALVLAASFLLLINPKLLLFDVGFQLSFLAVLGILYFFPWLSEKVKKWKSQKGKLLNSRFFQAIVSIILVTLSAQILTLPLVFYYFRVVSLVSPVANLLVLPILPVVMVGGLIMIGVGLVWSKIVLVLGVVVWLLLSYILEVVHLLSRIPYGYFRF